MKYVITNGCHYISTKGKIHTVNSIKKADKFDLEKANNLMKSIPNKLKIFEWKIVSEESNIDKTERINENIDTSKYEGLTDNILERMLDWEDYIKQLKEYLSILDIKLSNVDLEISDIEHCAENYDLDMFKGWKLYKMLQDARRRRRVIKQDRIKIDYILNRNFVDCTNSAISNYIKGLDNWTYTPRVLQELFNQ